MAELVERIVELAPRTDGVDEWLCRWRPGRRPEGAGALVRLSIETELPRCYPWLSEIDLQDFDRRSFIRGARCASARSTARDSRFSPT
jgi:hypothetical protein